MFAVKRLMFKTLENTVLSDDYYNYSLASIYRTLEKFDQKFGKTLHDKGIQLDGGHRYKLFSHTIYCENYKKIYGRNLVFKGSNVYLEIRGIKEIVDKIAKAFAKYQLLDINGNLFMYIGESKVTNVDLEKEDILFTTKTSVTTTTKDSSNKIRYVSIANEDKFFENIWNNLLRKYKLVYKEDFNNYEDIKIIFKSDAIKSEDIIIKNHKQVGYKFRLQVLSRDMKMKNIMYFLGIGERNAYGFGMLDIEG